MSKKLTLIPVMLCFFCMGFVDLVGIASNYVKQDLNLTDSQANIFPSLVFFWFLIFSVPTSMLMNRIGRKNTVLLSLIITALSLMIPLFGDSFGVMLTAFSLLGIGNALMQTSLNPLVSTVLGDKNLASTLTFGQFVKAIASFSAPYIAMWGATKAIPDFGFSWKILFLLYFVMSVFSAVMLKVTPVEEQKSEDKATTVLPEELRSTLESVTSECENQTVEEVKRVGENIYSVYRAEVSVGNVEVRRVNIGS